jgi:hypothetical protein
MKQDLDRPGSSTMTMIRPADRPCFSANEVTWLNIWRVTSASAYCPGCGAPIVQIEAGIVQVHSTIGLRYAVRLADEVRQLVPCPLMVVVRATP